MTTTERTRAAPARPAGPPGLRLYLTAALALSYVVAWWTLDGGAGAPAPAPVPRAPSGLATWYDDLPPDARPAVRLPEGWQLATHTEAAPRPVRVAPARRGRIRTRSS